MREAVIAEHYDRDDRNDKGEDDDYIMKANDENPPGYFMDYPEQAMERCVTPMSFDRDDEEDCDKATESKNEWSRSSIFMNASSSPRFRKNIATLITDAIESVGRID